MHCKILGQLTGSQYGTLLIKSLWRKSAWNIALRAYLYLPCVCGGSWPSHGSGGYRRPWHTLRLQRCSAGCHIAGQSSYGTLLVFRCRSLFLTVAKLLLPGTARSSRMPWLGQSSYVVETPFHFFEKKWLQSLSGQTFSCSLIFISLF